MSDLYELVNLWLPDGTWRGQFMDKATAEAWCKANGYKLDTVEISKRGPERKSRNSFPEGSFS
jgi:hypothetical protein